MRINRLRKSFLFAAFSVILLLAACSPADVLDTGNALTGEDLPPMAVLAAAEQLSQELNVSVDEIEVVSFEQVEWPDACLGVSQEGQVCAQVVTPGFRVVLNANGEQHEFRSDQEGKLIVESTQK